MKRNSLLIAAFAIAVSAALAACSPGAQGVVTGPQELPEGVVSQGTDIPNPEGPSDLGPGTEIRSDCRLVVESHGFAFFACKDYNDATLEGASNEPGSLEAFEIVKGDEATAVSFAEHKLSPTSAEELVAQLGDGFEIVDNTLLPIVRKAEGDEIYCLLPDGTMVAKLVGPASMLVHIGVAASTTPRIETEGLVNPGGTVLPQRIRAVDPIRTIVRPAR